MNYFYFDERSHLILSKITRLKIFFIIFFFMALAFIGGIEARKHYESNPKFIERIGMEYVKSILFDNHRQVEAVKENLKGRRKGK